MVVAVVAVGALGIWAGWRAVFDPYDSAKGVRGVPEFDGRPLSFALKRLGKPVRDFEFTIAQVDPCKMLRADLMSMEPPVPEDQPIREVTWERRHTFITVWYRGTGPQALGFNGVQWSKRIDTWAEPMSTRPAATRPLR